MQWLTTITYGFHATYFAGKSQLLPPECITFKQRFTQCCMIKYIFLLNSLHWTAAVHILSIVWNLTWKCIKCTQKPIAMSIRNQIHTGQTPSLPRCRRKESISVRSTLILSSIQILLAVHFLRGIILHFNVPSSRGHSDIGREFLINKEWRLLRCYAMWLL